MKERNKQDEPRPRRPSRSSSGRDSGDELIVGRQAVLEGLRCGKTRRLILGEGLKGEIIQTLLDLAAEKEVPVERMGALKFSQLTAGLPANQGVAALVPPFRYISLKELITLAKKGPDELFLIMLDHIEDPQNLGALMRTADAAGVHGIIIPDRRAAGVTAAVRKVSAGAAERLPVALVSNLNRAAEELKTAGCWLYGAEADAPDDYYRADFKVPLVLVIGSEGAGLSRLLRKNCDRVLNIPMPGEAGSLNVAAAAAVLVYAALGQRKGWHL